MIITEHTMCRNKLLKCPGLLNNRIFIAKTQINRRNCKVRCVCNKVAIFVFDLSTCSFLNRKNLSPNSFLKINKLIVQELTHEKS